MVDWLFTIGASELVVLSLMNVLAADESRALFRD